ncbi:MAG TPA: ABC transporter substrate-binding protein [Actinomycetota bacterium]
MVKFHTARAIALGATMALAAVACGQYPNTHDLALRNGTAAAGSLGGAGLGGSNQTTLGTTTNGTVAGAGATGGTTGGTRGTTQTNQTVNTNAPGHTTTGVTASTITIGIHAPITGAAPVTDQSFEDGKDLYWKYGDNGKPILVYGRHVNVIVEDDHYNPSYATLVCKQMVEQDHAFLLVGGAGTDQIVACAKYAATQPGPVPYLSAGVTQKWLEPYSNYFALSMTYPQQVPLLVQYMKKRLGVTNPSQAAMVATNTANFDDAVEAWQKLMPGSDVYRPDKSDTSAPQSTSQQLCNGPLDKYKVVFPLVAPVFFLNMAGAASCKPLFAGVGITMGLDAVAQVFCGEGYREAHFFSPASAFHDVGQANKQFMRAAQAKGVTPDDIMWLLWGLSGGLDELLTRAGPDLSRERFIQTTSTANVNGFGYYTSARYTPSNHFGATQVNMLKLHCPTNNTGYWLTEAQDVTHF